MSDTQHPPDQRTVRRKARVVGKTCPAGSRMGYEVYEALVPDECADCGRTIGVGERFTRQTMVGGGRRRWPFCADCEHAEIADAMGA